MWGLENPDDPVDMAKLTASIKVHEGTGPVVNGMHLPYKDSLGNETLGYGHLLSRGITNGAANQILSDDILLAVREAETLPAWQVIKGDDVRCRVVAECVFNLGAAKFKSFTKANAALCAGDYATCAAELLDSLWAHQTGRRAETLATMMLTGRDPAPLVAGYVPVASRDTAPPASSA